MIFPMQEKIFYKMLYVSKVNIEKNTARAKHIRSLIEANNNIQTPLKFLFYNFKHPFKNINTLKILLKNFFYNKKTIYTRDIEFALIASIFELKTIYEIHHFGMLKKTTKFCFLNHLILRFLSKISNVKFVCLTSNCVRTLKYLYPNISDQRLQILPDAGGFIKSIYPYKNHIRNDKNFSIELSYAGSFLPGKGGLETVFLAKYLKQFKFNLAGILEEKMLNKISSIENINFLGYLNDNQLIEFYDSCDILIAPIGDRIFLDKAMNNEITFYTSPLKLYEYSFTSKPVITVDRPCTRVFKNMPGFWFVNKEKANCLNTWEEIIYDVYNYLSKNKIKDLLEARKKSIYTWEKRIEEMIKIK